MLSLFKKNKTIEPNKIIRHGYTLWYGDVFDNNHNYLIININKEKTYYRYENNVLNGMINYSIGVMFLSDTIYDVNNDSYLDVLVKSSYRSSTVNKVYLQNTMADLDNALILHNTILNGKQLIGYLKHNSPIIKFYKFQWNEFTLDTLEWIAYDYSAKQPVYIASKKMDIFGVNDSNEYDIKLNRNEYQLLPELPLEYRKLDSLYFE